MSYAWHFYSFSKERFDTAFGGGSVDLRRAVIETAAWEESGIEDLEAAASVAETVTERGVSYIDLPPDGQRLLDDLIQIWFSPEGLWEEFEVEPESPDGLHPFVVKELAEKVPDPDVLKPLLGGRRFGDSSRPTGEVYFAAPPSELKAMWHAVCSAVQVPQDWSATYLPELITERLANPLDSALHKNRWLIGFLS